MYAVGTKVVHPCHGAGAIARIQKRSIGEEEHLYYVLDIDGAPGGLRVMVSVGRAGSSGLRRVGDERTLRGILSLCSVEPEEGTVPNDYRKRSALLGDWLKSGNFERVTDTVRVLHHRSARRPLGMTDSRILRTGMDLLATELAQAAGLDTEEARGQIEDRLSQMPCD